MNFSFKKCIYGIEFAIIEDTEVFILIPGEENNLLMLTLGLKIKDYLVINYEDKKDNKIFGINYCASKKVLLIKSE